MRVFLPPLRPDICLIANKSSVGFRRVNGDKRVRYHTGGCRGVIRLIEIGACSFYSLSLTLSVIPFCRQLNLFSLSLSPRIPPPSTHTPSRWVYRFRFPTASRHGSKNFPCMRTGGPLSSRCTHSVFSQGSQLRASRRQVWKPRVEDSSSDIHVLPFKPMTTASRSDLTGTFS